MGTDKQKLVVKDVKGLLSNVAHGHTIEITDEEATEFGKIMADRLTKALSGREPRSRAEEKVLHFSEVGHPCRRKLWYNVHTPEKAEKMSGDTILKFMYGDLIEELALLLVRKAGHEVTDEQKRCIVELPDGWVIRGYLDAKIDGQVVDVKSASTFSMKKFDDGLVDDPFGYRFQLRGYCESEGETSGGWLVIDKTLGHVTSYTEDVQPFSSEEKEGIVLAVDRDKPLPRIIEAVPEGKSGNMKLPTVCSYCPFKKECWADANGGDGLRTFLYSKGPVFLTEVKKEPNVPEVWRSITCKTK